MGQLPQSITVWQWSCSNDVSGASTGLEREPECCQRDDDVDRDAELMCNCANCADLQGRLAGGSGGVIVAPGWIGKAAKLGHQHAPLAVARLFKHTHLRSYPRQSSAGRSRRTRENTRNVPAVLLREGWLLDRSAAVLVLLRAPRKHGIVLAIIQRSH